MIHRNLEPALIKSAGEMPVVTVTGPRQSGKTTLCRTLFGDHPYRTMEDPDVRDFALQDPRGFLAELPDGAIIDEVQRAPDLLSYLQGIVDDNPLPGRWILTGSQNLALLQSVSQSLAGRTALHELLPLTWGEIREFSAYPETLGEALVKGGYPRIFDRRIEAPRWLRSYVGTYLERDVRTILNIGDLLMFQRFVQLCAGRTGQLLDYSALAGDCGISQPTARRWFSVLEASFIAFQLPAFHGNIRKRLVKRPKVYFYDTGLVCCLLGIREPAHLRSHPLRGSIFETWVVSEITKHVANRGESGGLAFYRDHNGAEVDLIIERPTSRLLLEVKSSATPSSHMFRAGRRVRRHLGEVELAVAYGGDHYQQRSDGEFLPWRNVRAAAMSDPGVAVRTGSSGRPVAQAHVLGLLPNKTWQSAETDAQGMAILDLDSLHVPMTIFVAAPGFEARLEREWVPAERALVIDLKPLPSGGAFVFPEGSGDIPGLTGRVTVTGGAFSSGFGAAFDTTRMQAETVAINGVASQPVAFRPGEELHLEDSDGHERWVRVVAIAGPSVLVEYRRERLGHARGQGEEVGS